MRTILVILTAASVALAPAGAAAAQQPATRLSPARDTVVPLDHIVANVGDQIITQYDLQERMVAMQQSPGFRAPQNEAEYRKLAMEVINQLVDEELLVQKAKDLKVEVPDGDLSPQVDKQVRDIRSRFKGDAEFRAELSKAGLGSPEEYRRFLLDQMRRGEFQRRVIEKLKQDGKIPPVNVSQAEVEEAFNKSKGSLPKRPATVTFRQIVVAPKPGAAARERARLKAESLLVEVKGGADFERVARRESADSGSREQGGDLGWARRGQMVEEFERWMFGLRPGDLSPVVETVHGYHIIRVDRVQPGEVKSRHILVRAALDSGDDARARVEADSVALRWASGVTFDTLAKLHHDFASGEETSLLTPMARDSMPASYQTAFANKKAGDIVTFEIPGPFGHPKVVVAQLLTMEAGGEYTLRDLKERVRQQLVDEGSYRRFLDGLRKETFVRIRLDAPVSAAPAAKP
ncbi:MAG: peptidylprolyl isomerase [Gemmatimonadota bacterium]